MVNSLSLLCRDIHLLLPKDMGALGLWAIGLQDVHSIPHTPAFPTSPILRSLALDGKLCHRLLWFSDLQTWTELYTNFPCSPDCRPSISVSQRISTSIIAWINSCNKLPFIYSLSTSFIPIIYISVSVYLYIYIYISTLYLYLLLVL